MPELHSRSSSRAVALTHPQELDSDSSRCLAVVMLAAGAGAVLAGLVLISGGGLLVALMSYSLGGTLFAAACVGFLLLKDMGLARLRSAWRRIDASGRFRRLPS